MTNKTQNPLGERTLALIELLRRCGLTGLQMRYSDDEKPVVWMAVACVGEAGYAVAASFDPEKAIDNLSEEMIDGGACNHCGRPAGVMHELGSMPAAREICWYQYDPSLKRYARHCAEQSPTT